MSMIQNESLGRMEGGDLFEEDVERSSGDVVGFAEDWVEGSLAEDGRSGGRYAPGHYGGEPLQAVLPSGAPPQCVTGDAVDGLAVALELGLGQVELRGKLHGKEGDDDMWAGTLTDEE